MRALDGRLHRWRAQLERIEHRSPLADPTLLLASRRQRLDGLTAALARAAQTRVVRSRERIRVVERALLHRSPISLVAARRSRFEAVRGRLDLGFLVEKQGRRDDLAERLGPAFARVVAHGRQRLDVLKAGLGTLDPRAPLRRGFAIVHAPDGKPLVDPADAPPGTRLRVELARGDLTARVESDGKHGGEQIGLF